MKRPSGRSVVGAFLLAHGLAHAMAGIQVIAGASSWLLQAFGVGAAQIRWTGAVTWTVGMAGFAAAGLGLMGLASFHPRWKAVVGSVVAASLVLLLLYWPTQWAVPGILIDFSVLALLRGGDLPAPRPPLGAVDEDGRLRGAARGLAVLAVGCLALNALALPWHTRWGSTEEELSAALPGDELLVGRPTYWIQHGITIDAPVEAVWPWLAQLGTDRGGFYSHVWLENLFGIPVANADRIHPEWQKIETGDLVVATPPGYLGLDRALGWRVARVDPERVLVLKSWGSFVLRPRSDGTTRLIVRTRSSDPANLPGIALSWLGLVVFAPAHFIMESGMLEGIKVRAEAASRGSPRARVSASSPQMSIASAPRLLRGGRFEEDL